MCRGDSQDAGNPVGGAGLPDFFTVSHVRGGAHQDHHPAAGLGLEQQLEKYNTALFGSMLTVAQVEEILKTVN